MNRPPEPPRKPVPTPGICQRPDCEEPKVPGRGSKYCASHRAVAEAEKIERRKDAVRLSCQFPGCEQPKPRGAGQRYCSEHRASAYAREVARQAGRMRTHRSGLTEQQYQAMVAAQNGLCALCGQPPGKRQLSVDHDHACCPGRDSCGKCLRDLLCGRCNPMLGYAHDDKVVLQQAIAYLEKWDFTRSR